MVADTLDRFNIVGKKDLYPNQLSGGQQQLVGIARAVIHRPALLLADEPTGNLHSTQAKEIMELFQQLNREGTTIVQVTHSEVNACYGSRILEVRDGWLVRDTANPGLEPGYRGEGMRRVSCAGSMVQKTLSVLCAAGLLVSTTFAQTNPAGPLPSAPAGSAAISAPDHRTAGASGGAAAAGYLPGTFPH